MRGVLILVLCVLALTGCRAQLVVSDGDIYSAADDAAMMDFVQWYNRTMDGATIVKDTKFELPAVSDIVAVVVYPADMKQTLEITRKSGSRIGFIEPGHLYRDEVSYNTRGEVIGGLQDVVITGGEMTIVFKRCPECVFKPGYRGDL